MFTQTQWLLEFIASLTLQWKLNELKLFYSIIYGNSFTIQIWRWNLAQFQFQRQKPNLTWTLFSSYLEHSSSQWYATVEDKERMSKLSIDNAVNIYSCNKIWLPCSALIIVDKLEKKAFVIFIKVELNSTFKLILKISS